MDSLARQRIINKCVCRECGSLLVVLYTAGIGPFIACASHSQHKGWKRSNEIQELESASNKPRPLNPNAEKEMRELFC